MGKCAQASLVRHEMMLLTASLEMEDSCWEQRLRTGLCTITLSLNHIRTVSILVGALTDTASLWEYYT